MSSTLEAKGLQTPQVEALGRQSQVRVGLGFIDPHPGVGGSRKPLWEEQVLGSYEDWSAIMGGILAVNEVEGFLSNRDEYESHDPETLMWEGFLQLWWKKFGDKNLGVGEVFDIAVGSGIDGRKKGDIHDK